MKILSPYLTAGLLFIAFCGVATAADTKTHLTLPPALYAVPGVPMNIDFRNTILAEPEEGYTFKVECKVGKVDGNQRWTVNAKKDEVGEHVLKMRLSDANGKLVDEASTLIRVVPRDAGSRVACGVWVKPR